MLPKRFIIDFGKSMWKFGKDVHFLRWFNCKDPDAFFDHVTPKELRIYIANNQVPATALELEFINYYFETHLLLALSCSSDMKHLTRIMVVIELYVDLLKSEQKRFILSEKTLESISRYVIIFETYSCLLDGKRLYKPESIQ